MTSTIPTLRSPFTSRFFGQTQPTYQSDDPNNVAVGVTVSCRRPATRAIRDGPRIDLSQENSNWSSQTEPACQDNLVEPLAPDPSLPYVLAVVVDAQGNAPADLTVDETQAHFKIWVIADVTYGFSPHRYTTGVATADGQRVQGRCRKGPTTIRLLAFDWNSGLSTGQVKRSSAGMSFTSRFWDRLTQLNSQLGTNDVIDVQLIGHSRGSAVIGQAMKIWSRWLLEGRPLAEGYYKLTFLDPHPANLDTVRDVSITLPVPASTYCRNWCTSFAAPVRRSVSRRDRAGSTRWKTFTSRTQTSRFSRAARPAS